MSIKSDEMTIRCRFAMVKNIKLKVNEGNGLTGKETTRSRRQGTFGGLRQ